MGMVDTGRILSEQWFPPLIDRMQDHDPNTAPARKEAKSIESDRESFPIWIGSQ